MRRHLLFTSSIIVLALACDVDAVLAAPASGPSSPPVAEVTEVVVTGSHISRRDYVAESPVVSVGQDAIEATGQVTVDRALAQMPQFAPAQGVQEVGDAQAATGFSGGQAYADLRSLGPNRALVLLDGRRLQSSNPDGSVDLNTIPLSLLQSVEVITGGASAAYGSDAIAGVINFKFNPNFSGMQFDVQHGGSTRGDATNNRIGAAIGGTFDDGRGKALLALEYANRNAVYGAARSFFAQGRPNGFLQNGTVTSANNPFQLSAVNAVLASQGLPALPGGPIYTGAIGANTGGGSIFTTNYAPAAPEGYTGPGLPLVRTLGSSLQTLLFPFFVIQVPLKKESLFSRASYHLTDHAELFGQAMFTHYSATDTTSPAAAAGPHAISIPVTNPFIPTGLAAILAARPDPTANFLWAKITKELGNRIESYDYNVYQLLGGLRGDLPHQDWTWEAYGSFGQTRFVNGLEHAGSDIGYRALVNGTSTAAGCTGYGGYNPFGINPMTPACQAVAGRNLTNTAVMTQRDLEASMQGKLLQLPAGEMRFALGADYRSTLFDFRPDSEMVVGDAFGYGAINPTHGDSSVTEVYGELLIPVLSKLPLVQELNLDLGYRYSNYARSGGVSTYKANFDWRPTETVLFRGGYERAIRAASVGELFAPQTQGYFNIGAPSDATHHFFANDPCDSNSAYFLGPNAAKVKSLCSAEGVPASILGTPFFEYTSSAFGQSGGNDNLQPETADTFSIGAVWTPKLDMPLLSDVKASVDYFNMDIKDAIGSIATTDVLSRCFNGDSISNPEFSLSNKYCQLISRDPTTGFISLIKAELLNLAEYRTSGLDFQLDWGIKLGDLGLPEDAGALRLNTAVSYVPEFELSSFTGNAFVNYAGSIGNSSVSPEISHPKWKAVTNLGYVRGPVSLGLTWRYIGAMNDSSAVTNPTSTIPGVGAYSYFDLRGAWKIRDDLQISAGVTNLADKAPPVVGGIAGFTDASSYDIIGRSYFVALKARF